jgi:undecaprenyl diphosphate synthase
VLNPFTFLVKNKPVPGSSAEIESIPRHVAVIMDGNRRWAEKRRLPKVAGYKYGLEALRDIYNSCIEIGIKHLTIYAFSTENKFRPKDEVKYLEWLLIEAIDTEARALCEKNVKIRFLGRLEEVDAGMLKKMREIESLTSSNTGLSLQVMYNYGGRSEIVDAVKKISELSKEYGELKIDEKLVADNLYLAGIPDPDLLIRTGGDMRVSNFLLWQIAYSEIIVTEKYFPDFRKKEFLSAIRDYSNRIRRFGR